MDNSLMVRPASPVTPFKFPFDMNMDGPSICTGVDILPCANMDSVTRVVGLPRVYGLKGR